ncbi:MAG: hypothetical protein IH612_17005 [Desulfofustis sp.]|nr:hypothetical protein [Desulfofustis sp.]
MLFGNNHPATMTGIQHSRLAWLESESLPELPLARVQQEIDKRFLNGQRS